MDIFFNNNIKVLCHGFTGKMATYHSKLSMNYNTNIVAGISPNKGNTYHMDIPVFNNAIEAVLKTHANLSLIFVPAENCKDSILDSISAGIKNIICITEGMPICDMLFLKKIFKQNNIFFLGPNSPGLVVPDVCRLGIMPINIHKKGIVGIISRSGTLTYEAINQTSFYGLGQSISIGIGGDPIVGSTFLDILKYLNECSRTKIILLIGEIGGYLEEQAAYYLANNINKPIFSYIAGTNAPLNKRMGHAGAIISNNSHNALNKIKILQNSNVKIINSISEIGSTIYKFYIDNN